MTAREIIDIYISFFEKRGHKRIANSPLVPENDPTTLFTSSGMQPLIPYLLGEQHPGGKRLVNVQNCFRAVDIEEVGDNRHETFFRMLGNWSLGDYFKKEEIPWLWELLTKEFGLAKEKLYITIFKGTGNVGFDNESEEIWKEVLRSEGMNPEERIFAAGVDKNWWSRSGIPDNMPVGEIGGPDTEVYYKFDELSHKQECKDNPVDCECGKFLEIANSVFMQYKKSEKGFEELPQKNVDYGGGIERLLAAVENKSDVFQTSLFAPVIEAIEKETGKNYQGNEKAMQIVTDHLTASVFIANENIKPSKNQQGYILRRLLRRAFDNFSSLGGKDVTPVLQKIIEQYKDTDPALQENFEEIKLTLSEEKENYKKTISLAIEKTLKYEIKGQSDVAKKISANDAFKLYTTHGLSPTQIRSLGYVFDEQQFADLMEKHKSLSRTASAGMFKGGLADHSELTIMGHTATHLLHQALRDMFGEQLHQTGSNITSERVRFDFNFDRKLEDEEISELEKTVNQKIKENLPVHFEILPLEKAKTLGAIGLFDEKYAKDVKVYFIDNYSAEFCGGPHVDFTGKIKKFRIIKQENMGHGQRRLYVKVSDQI
jgi:alanyl-tRNA synthetase